MTSKSISKVKVSPLIRLQHTALYKFAKFAIQNCIFYTNSHRYNIVVGALCCHVYVACMFHITVLGNKKINVIDNLRAG